MAIKNEITGEYLKVTGFQMDFAVGNHHINYLLFANEDQRIRYDTGLSPYELFKSGQYNGIGHIETAIDVVADSSQSIRANMFSACYQALKNDMFADWIDV